MESSPRPFIPTEHVLRTAALQEFDEVVAAMTCAALPVRRPITFTTSTECAVCYRPFSCEAHYVMGEECPLDSVCEQCDAADQRAADSSRNEEGRAA